MRGEPRRVWVTRSTPGAERTAEALRVLGYEALIWSLLTVRALPGREISVNGISAIAFTSANGVTAFMRRSLRRDRTVFAVGAGTAAAAKGAGFTQVLSVDGDVEALAAGIASRRRELPGAVLHACAVERAGDLEGALAPFNIKVVTTPVYETAPAEVPREVIRALPQLYAATAHSAKAAGALAAVLKAHPTPKLWVCCLSRQVARPLRRIPLARLSAAAKPTEQALVDLFRQ